MSRPVPAGLFFRLTCVFSARRFQHFSNRHLREAKMKQISHRFFSKKRAVDIEKREKWGTL